LFPVPLFKFAGIRREYVRRLSDITSELKKTLLEAENNVHPQCTNKDKWYKNQYVLFEFCNFIEKIEIAKQSGSIEVVVGVPSVATVHEKSENGDNEYVHIHRCKKLIEAMKMIQSAIGV